MLVYSSSCIDKQMQERIRSMSSHSSLTEKQTHFFLPFIYLFIYPLSSPKNKGNKLTIGSMT